MNKKDLDVLELMRESIIKANKDLGFVKSIINEQKESAFSEPFDPEKHMPKFQITKNWGIKGTTDAKQIDAVVANLIDVGEKNGLKRYKKSIEKMNSVLGTSYATEESLPKDNKPAQAFKINEIISSMQLKSLFHAVIGSEDPKVAGKIYETLIARLAGGFTQQVETYSIEDFIDGENNYISLKVIKDTTTIDGSKTNLAIALAKKPENEGVYFLVNVKDSEDNPFKVTPFSFKVTRGNFFYFISGKQDYATAEKEMEVIKNRLGIVRGEIEKKKAEKQKEFEKKSKSLSGEEEKENKPETLEEAINIFAKETGEEKLVNAYKTLFPEEKEANFESIRKKFMQFLSSAAKAITADPQQKILLDNAIKITSKGKFKNLSDSVDTIVTAAPSPKIFKASSLEELKNAITFIDSLSGIDLAEYAETDPNVILKIDKLKYSPDKIIDTKESTREEQINSINAFIKNNEPKYVSARNKVKTNLKAFFDLYNKLDEAVAQAKPEKIKTPATVDIKKSAASSEAGGHVSGLTQKIDTFWEELKSISMTETFAEILSEAKEGGETQFSMSISAAKKFAQSDDSAQLDESYPQIVVTYEGLKDSTTDSAEAFRNWAQPLYEGMHILTQGVNQYFIEDNVAGLTEADKGVKQVDGQVARLSKEGKGASALAEVKNSDKEILKKSALDDILIELLD